MGVARLSLGAALQRLCPRYLGIGRQAPSPPAPLPHAGEGRQWSPQGPHVCTESSVYQDQPSREREFPDED